MRWSWLSRVTSPHSSLGRSGVKPGDHVGRIGGTYGVSWARLLRVTVVAEVPRANAREFWYATPAVQASVIDTFRRMGVTALVTKQVPPEEIYPHGSDWIQLGSSSFYALKIAQPANR